MTASAAAARSLLAPDERALVDEYAAEFPQHDWHVVAAFVLADEYPPYEPAYTGSQMANIILPHYAKYAPNGQDDDGLAGVGPLEAKR